MSEPANAERDEPKVRLPWWWRLNPWLALSRRDRAYAAALGIIREQAIETTRLRLALAARAAKEAK